MAYVKQVWKDSPDQTILALSLAISDGLLPAWLRLSHCPIAVKGTLFTVSGATINMSRSNATATIIRWQAVPA